MNQASKCTLSVHHHGITITPPVSMSKQTKGPSRGSKGKKSTAPEQAELPSQTSSNPGLSGNTHGDPSQRPLAPKPPPGSASRSYQSNLGQTYSTRPFDGHVRDTRPSPYAREPVDEPFVGRAREEPPHSRGAEPVPSASGAREPGRSQAARPQEPRDKNPGNFGHPWICRTRTRLYCTSYATKMSVAQHVNGHDDVAAEVTPYKCWWYTCNETFDSQKERRKHVNVHEPDHEDPAVPCRFGGCTIDRFNYTGRRRVHENESHKIRQFCHGPDCELFFGTIKERDTHRNLYHAGQSFNEPSGNTALTGPSQVGHISPATSSIDEASFTTVVRGPFAQMEGLARPRSNSPGTRVQEHPDRQVDEPLGVRHPNRWFCTVEGCPAVGGFESKQAVDSHVLSVAHREEFQRNPPTRFVCQWFDCSKGFVSWHLRDTHEDEEHTETDLQAQVEAYRNEYVREHTRPRLGNSKWIDEAPHPQLVAENLSPFDHPWICRVPRSTCFVFDKKGGVRAHYSRVHREPETAPFKCRFYRCNVICDTQRAREWHEDYVHEPDKGHAPIRCRFGGCTKQRGFATYQMRLEHEKAKHPNRISCQFQKSCRSSFDTIAARNAHQNTMHPGRTPPSQPVDKPSGSTDLESWATQATSSAMQELTGRTQGLGITTPTTTAPARQLAQFRGVIRQRSNSPFERGTRRKVSDIGQRPEYHGAQDSDSEMEDPLAVGHSKRQSLAVSRPSTGMANVMASPATGTQTGPSSSTPQRASGGPRGIAGLLNPQTTDAPMGPSSSKPILQSAQGSKGVAGTPSGMQPPGQRYSTDDRTRMGTQGFNAPRAGAPPAVGRTDTSSSQMRQGGESSHSQQSRRAESSARAAQGSIASMLYSNDRTGPTRRVPSGPTAPAAQSEGSRPATTTYEQDSEDDEPGPSRPSKQPPQAATRQPSTDPRESAKRDTRKDTRRGRH